MSYLPSEEEINGLKYCMDTKVMNVFNSWLKNNHINHESSPVFDLSPTEYQFYIISQFFNSYDIDLLSLIPNVMKDKYKTLSSEYPSDISRYISNFWCITTYQASKALEKRLFPKPKTFDELKVGDIVKAKFTEGEFNENVCNVEYEITEKHYNYMYVKILECDDSSFFQVGQIEKLNKKQPKRTTFGGPPQDAFYNDQLDLDQQDPEFWDSI
ncbi:hypothetical protein PK35_14630 [Tamlana nanhaiensis]|uniref:Uncharacterized protein n=1 Tax=Neotamlana nanhaiensis TaxID=1382798 RepID=A0A0D7VWU5_9FLAO|nr:hypothetical protein [Tamlana nanhaiensis]KJD31345.1 hypothetical protein PK35_14630 [Tamlana nanhaiensis]